MVGALGDREVREKARAIAAFLNFSFALGVRAAARQALFGWNGRAGVRDRHLDALALRPDVRLLELRELVLELGELVRQLAAAAR